MNAIHPAGINPLSLKGYKIENHKLRNVFASVLPLDSSSVLSEENISDIVEICNQEDVYSLLFKEKFNGERYKDSDAKSFVEWANKGWQEKAYFVFIIKYEYNRIVGAVDIKSSNPDGAEIGYWASCDYPGFMTNAVLGLIKEASNAGYRSLAAYTKLENNKSKGVLLRAGFEYFGQEKLREDGVMDKFVMRIIK